MGEREGRGERTLGRLWLLGAAVSAASGLIAPQVEPTDKNITD